MWRLCIILVAMVTHLTKKKLRYVHFLLILVDRVMYQYRNNNRSTVIMKIIVFALGTGSLPPTFGPDRRETERARQNWSAPIAGDAINIMSNNYVHICQISASRVQAYHVLLKSPQRRVMHCGSLSKFPIAIATKLSKRYLQ